MRLVWFFAQVNMKISSKIGRLCYFIVVLLYCWVSYEFYHSGNTLFENGFEVVCLPLLLFLVSVLILWLITRIGGGKHTITTFVIR